MSPRWGSAAALAIAVLHFASFDVVDQALITDIRYYVYLAWQVTEGVAPHVSTFDPKTQVASFAGALFLTVGDWLGADGLVAMRVGYLGIASVGGWLLYFFFQRLTGSVTAGLLGVLSYCSFGLIGGLASIGPIPKLVTALCVTGVALCVHRRRWALAGFVATLGFLDWQIGVLTCLVALAAALVGGTPRWRAGLKVILGGAAAGGPYALYFALHGALGKAFEQTIVSALFRGSSALGRQTFEGRLGRIQRWAESDCPEQLALFYLAPLGIVVALYWLVRWRHDERLRLLLPITAVNVGLVAFCLTDFQGHGDLHSALHALAFFQGCWWVGLYLLVRSRLGPDAMAGRGQALCSAFFLVAAVAAARPSWLRPELVVSSALVDPAATLDDQREVAREVTRLCAGRKLGVLQSSELLYLMQYTNPLPTVYWNVATLGYFREDEDEAESRIVARILTEGQVDAVIYFTERNAGRIGSSWTTHRIASANGAVVVLLELRER